jgi:hypothetical protein
MSSIRKAPLRWMHPPTTRAAVVEECHSVWLACVANGKVCTMTGWWCCSPFKMIKTPSLPFCRKHKTHRLCFAVSLRFSRAISLKVPRLPRRRRRPWMDLVDSKLVHSQDIPPFLPHWPLTPALVPTSCCLAFPCFVPSGWRLTGRLTSRFSSRLVRHSPIFGQ